MVNPVTIAIFRFRFTMIIPDTRSLKRAVKIVYYFIVYGLGRKLVGLECRFRSSFNRRKRLPENQHAQFCGIIQSYKRPKNIQLILDCMLACEYITRVIVSNNNPEIDLREYLVFDDPRVVLKQNTIQRPSAWRWRLAAENTPFQWFVNIDDDVFPSPGQITKMASTLVENPGAPTGCMAEFCIEDVLVMGSSAAFVDKHDRYPRALLWVYLFSREHVEAYFRELGGQGIDDALQFSDDVLMCLAVSEKPVVVNFPILLKCPTLEAENIANFRQHGFFNNRFDIYRSTGFAKQQRSNEQLRS